MRAHQEHGAHHREEQHADEEHERGDFVLVERFEGVEIGEPDAERIAFRRGLAGRPTCSAAVIRRTHAATVITCLRLRGGIPMPLARTNPGICRPIPPSRRTGGPRNCRRDALRLAETNAPPKLQ